METTKRLQAYKFEMYRPEGETLEKLESFFEASRRIYNLGLNFQKGRKDRGEKFLSAFGLGYYLKDWRASEPLYGSAPQDILEATLHDLDFAFKKFFKEHKQGTGFPKPKPKHAPKSIRARKGIRVDRENGRVKISKCGWLRFRMHREILGEPKNVTISVRSDKWFVSIQTEREVVVGEHESNSEIGIDVGVARFATLSDGSFIEPVNSFRKHEDALRRASQSLSRKRKFSKNWKKAQARVAKIHSRIANVRCNFLHETSSRITRDHKMIAVEDLKIKNMSASAAGSVDEPGANVAAKSGLNKSILDQGWGEFRRQLGYKAQWRGGELILVPPQNTSRECPECGHTDAENRRSQAAFVCVSCGFVGNADHVGAVNILRRAVRARIACQASPDGGRQQEPAEAAISVEKPRRGGRKPVKKVVCDDENLVASAV